MNVSWTLITQSGALQQTLKCLTQVNGHKIVEVSKGSQTLRNLEAKCSGYFSVNGNKRPRGPRGTQRRPRGKRPLRSRGTWKRSVPGYFSEDGNKAHSNAEASDWRPTANQEMIGTTETEVSQSLSSEVVKEVSKSGKETIIAEVRGFRILLSTDSQGRDLPLIPLGSDGFSIQNLSGIRDQMHTLPQSQHAEDDWYKVGPEFQHGQARFCTYDISFYAGVVLCVSHVLDL